MTLEALAYKSLIQNFALRELKLTSYELELLLRAYYNGSVRWSDVNVLMGDHLTKAEVRRYRVAIDSVVNMGLAHINGPLLMPSNIFIELHGKLIEYSNKLKQDR